MVMAALYYLMTTATKKMVMVMVVMMMMMMTMMTMMTMIMMTTVTTVMGRLPSQLFFALVCIGSAFWTLAVCT